jgi:DNA-directed RNA polymerase subunit alpha
MKRNGIQMPKMVQFDEENFTDRYGQFVLEPLERGFGTTIGHSLRRMLLASIPGAAITWIKIDGIPHEFSVIENVHEDVPEIVLNLKWLVVRLHEGGPRTLTIDVSTPGEVTAADIQTDSTVEIINPDLYIATLNEGGHLRIEMNVEEGRGYVEADRNFDKKQTIGVIPIDSIFSPVTRVKYHVENTRIGQQTDYDKLFIEIWTDGSIKPEEAIIHAAKILRDHLKLFTSLHEEPTFEEEEEIDQERERVREQLRRSVKELELSVRSSNCLKAAKINTIADLVQKTEVEMLKYRNFGKKSLQELTNILEVLGLEFGLDVKEYFTEEELAELQKANEQEEEFEE